MTVDLAVTQETIGTVVPLALPRLHGLTVAEELGVTDG